MKVVFAPEVEEDLYGLIKILVEPEEKSPFRSGRPTLHRLPESNTLLNNRYETANKSRMVGFLHELLS